MQSFPLIFLFKINTSKRSGTAHSHLPKFHILLRPGSITAPQKKFIKELHHQLSKKKFGINAIEAKTKRFILGHQWVQHPCNTIPMVKYPMKTQA